MSESAANIGRGSDISSSTATESLQGKMEHPSHTVFVNTKTGKSYDTKIPHTILTSDEPFTHKVSAAWQDSKFKGVARLIYYIALIALGILQKVPDKQGERDEQTETEMLYQKASPSSTGPPVGSVPEGKTQPAVELITLAAQKAHSDSSEVKIHVAALFGDKEEQLQKEWKKVNKQNQVSDISIFFEKVNNRIKEISAIDLPFTETEKNSRLQQLNTLKVEVTNKLFGPMDTAEAQWKEVTSDQSPHALFNFFDSIDKEEARLCTMNLSGSASEARQERLKILSEWKDKTAQEMETRYTSAKKEFEQTIPADIKLAKITLSKSDTALVRAQEKTQTDLDKLKNAEKELTDLVFEQQQLPNNLDQLKTARQKKFDEEIGPDLRTLDSEIEPSQTQLDKLHEKDQRQKDLEAIQQGKVTMIKKGLFGGGSVVIRTLTGEEKKELILLMDGQIKRGQEAQAIATKIEEVRNGGMEAILLKEKERVGQFFDEDIKKKEARLKTLPGLIVEKKSTAQQLLEAWTKSNKELQELEESISTAEQTLIREKKNLNSQMEALARLTLSRSAFQAYRATHVTARKESASFILDYLRTNQKTMEEQLIQELSALNLTATEAQKLVSAMLLQ